MSVGLTKSFASSFPVFVKSGPLKIVVSKKFVSFLFSSGSTLIEAWCELRVWIKASNYSFECVHTFHILSRKRRYIFGRSLHFRKAVSSHSAMYIFAYAGVKRFPIAVPFVWRYHLSWKTKLFRVRLISRSPFVHWFVNFG